MHRKIVLQGFTASQLHRKNANVYVVKLHSSEASEVSDRMDGSGRTRSTSGGRFTVTLTSILLLISLILLGGVEAEFLPNCLVHPKLQVSRQGHALLEDLVA